MTIAMIVAAGTGSRMSGADKPKQFLLVNNKPLMIYTIEAFQMHEDIDAIVVVTGEGYEEQVKYWCKQYGLSKVQAVVLGGDSRQGSVYNGLQAIKKMGAKSDDIILIQDAINRLTEYDPELLPVAEAIDPLTVINATTVDELKTQMAEAKDQIAEARQALIELIY